MQKPCQRLRLFPLGKGVVALFNVEEESLPKGVGAVFKAHRLISVKLNPIGDGASVEGDCLLTAIFVEDEEIISEGTILLGEFEGHSVFNLGEEEGEDIHIRVVFGVTPIL